MKSILMLGQSNMAGRGFLDEVPPIYNERIQMLRNGHWQMMSEPINYDRPVSGISLAASFAQAWCIDNPGDTIGLIPCAEGGSSLDEWAIDKPLYRHALSQTKFALENSELIGILWHQGESDSYNGQYKDYHDKLLEIVNSLRIDLSVPDIPFVIGGLPDFLGKTGFGASCTEYTLIEKELEHFTQEQDNCYFVSAKDLESNPDGIHINAQSLRIFGLRYYESFSKQYHLYKPLQDEDKLVEALYKQEPTKKELSYIQTLNFSLGKISFDEFMKNITDINK